MHYTQDESYYILDCDEDAVVYLGLKEGVCREKMLEALREAQEGGKPFDAQQYVNRWPAKKHDHFLIPAGTIHCSGSNCMVLEVSATPYIFTFKLWDWGRLGLDGKPRPVHLQHGEKVIQWDRTTQWVKDNLIDRAQVMAEADGFCEEFTGLHEREFLETRRDTLRKEHAFTGEEASDVQCGGRRRRSHRFASGGVFGIYGALRGDFHPPGVHRGVHHTAFGGGV